MFLRSLEKLAIEEKLGSKTGITILNVKGNLLALLSIFFYNYYQLSLIISLLLKLSLIFFLLSSCLSAISGTLTFYVWAFR